ncbi:MAG TPA: hypothetical protein VK716_07245 [Terracidiphilus sp.]|jgi:hypothetical protein|nr:hypothetical protein [Terracidiphilus sp.]
MTEEFDKKGRAGEPAGLEALDPTLKQALGEFKASVHAWSEAELGRTRTARQGVVHRTWRLAASWSLAGLMLAGTLGGGLYERHESQARAATAAVEAARERAAAEQQAREQEQKEEEILASVDTEVSSEVPNAMEPLAILGDETESQQKQ